MCIFRAAVVALCCAAVPVVAEVEIDVHYLRVAQPLPPVLSNLDPLPEDLGLAGARVALADNQTTGTFMGQTWALTETTVPEGDDPLAAARTALAETDLLMIDAPSDVLTAISDLPEATEALLFNVTNGDTNLRETACRANMLHTLPSDAMRTDALMQFAVKKRWSDLVLITGTNPRDTAFANALDRSATKFGLKIRAAKTWEFDADMRRNASAEVPLFTQDFGDYDLLLVADEIGDFGRYILYNTWEARPVGGSEGLHPVTWAPVVEQWGAVQLQNRFEDLAERNMRPEDYGAWAAMRALGEAVTRSGAGDASTLRGYLLGPDFELAGFKGRPLTFRTWNGQLRQPIPIVHPRALVAQAPLEGFLHQVTELDTLGIDEPETTCTAFAN